MKRKTIFIVLVAIAVIGLLYWPTIRWLVQSWISNSYYSHGFLVPLIAGFIVWTKRSQLKAGDPSIIGAFVVTLGALAYIQGLVWAMRFLSAFSLLIVLSGLSLLFFGTRATRAIMFPLSFLIFMIPLPFIQELGFSLQTISIHSSAWLVRVLGLTVTTVGPEIHFGDTVFTIGLPCSGINTLIALLALAAVYVYLLSGSIYKRAILFVIAFPLAIGANILRISSLILIAKYHSVEAASGFYHDISSPLFFLIAFLFLILFGRILGCRLRVRASRR